MHHSRLESLAIFECTLDIWGIKKKKKNGCLEQHLWASHRRRRLCTLYAISLLVDVVCLDLTIIPAVELACSLQPSHSHFCLPSAPHLVSLGIWKVSSAHHVIGRSTMSLVCCTTLRVSHRLFLWSVSCFNKTTQQHFCRYVSSCTRGNKLAS